MHYRIGTGSYLPRILNSTIPFPTLLLWVIASVFRQCHPIGVMRRVPERLRRDFRRFPQSKEEKRTTSVMSRFLSPRILQMHHFQSSET